MAAGSLSYPLAIVGPRNTISPGLPVGSGRPSPSRIAISGPAAGPTEPTLRSSRRFAAICDAPSVMPYVSMTGTPNRDSSPLRMSEGSDAEAERTIRKEDRRYRACGDLLPRAGRDGWSEPPCTSSVAILSAT